ncbi:MAG TPA: N-acetylmuramoyl-L-alanine amidase [Opitutaceae bacterium]|nr:N-acetylmuramoyl-L-alanine amidase [Opitutaceae bacterium]
MRPAAFALLSIVLLAAPSARAEFSSFVNKGIDYVSLDDVAARLGLRTERGLPVTTEILKDGAKPIAKFTDRSRDTDVEGLRVFMGDPVIEHGGAFFISRADYEYHLLPRLRPDLCGALPRQPHIIVIDAGHGGIDHGTENPRLGTMEKTYTLDVALRLRALLEAAGYKVMMIRDTDVTVPKESRAAIANDWSADLYISIHFNSTYPNSKTAGVEVMSFPWKAQRSTDSWSPGKSNDSESGNAPVNTFAAWNTLFGSFLHRHLLESLHSGDRGEKFEHLAVLRGLACPGILVEPAFLSSDAEGPSLATAAYRDAIAGAIAAGIHDYDEELRKLRPAPTPMPASAVGRIVPPAGSAGQVRSQPTRPSGP